MRRFKFRLEPVISLKKKLEDERKLALGLARKDLRQKEEHLNGLCEHRQACQEFADEKLTEYSLDIAKMLIHYAYIEKLTDDIASHTCGVEQSRQNVEKKRGLLLESSREKKTLERLKEKMKERHVYQAKRAEQAVLDETAATFHMRPSDRKIVWKKE
jgi:flagellar FliJ protein